MTADNINTVRSYNRSSPRKERIDRRMFLTQGPSPDMGILELHWQDFLEKAMEYPPRVRESLLQDRVRFDGMITRGLYEELEEIYSILLK